MSTQGHDAHATRVRCSSFAGLHHARPERIEPASVEELARVLREADRTGRSVTVQGGGQTLDAQALNDDLVISTRRLDSVRVDAERALLHAGPGATWGAIFRALPVGLVPHVTVTTSAATAAGTLANDGHARSSPVFGRESRHVERIELLTVDGRVLECARGGERHDVLEASAGGLGFLGAIVGVTYRLLDLRHLAVAGRQVRVRTLARRHRSLASLLEDLLPCFVDGREGRGAEAVYGLYLGGGRGLSFRSHYTKDVGRRPMPNHDVRNPLRVVIDLLLRAGPTNALMWRAIHSLYYTEARTFVDDLEDYTFFMDGSRRAGDVARRLGVELRTAQQSFVLPFDFGDRDRSLARVGDLVERARREASRAKLTPLMFDLLYVAGDAAPRPSLIPDDSGLVVTVALDASSATRLLRVRRYLQDLTHEVGLAGGRIDLGKMVEARDSDLRAMYGPAFDRFVALKRAYDPNDTLRNSFSERIRRLATDA